MASYVSPKIRDKFETLSVDLKNCILERNVRLETLQDLINVLDEIVKEESPSPNAPDPVITARKAHDTDVF